MTGRLGAQPRGFGLNAHPREVQPISVPARQDRRLSDRVAVAVQAHRLAQVLKLLIGKFANHTRTPQPQGKVRRTLPVLRISVVVVPLAVVQEGKPREDARVHVEPGGELSPMKPHPAPVRQAVDAVRKVQPELRPDDRQCLVDDVGAALRASGKD